ncbi:ATP-binding protein [Mesorhizobium sp. ASY16-5R]|uniref:ATP-binding protein n=1 Tax=Mesorhizobium sp. ASY16-5R TaxID=3445772 RepID=UPI003F9FAB98
MPIHVPVHAGSTAKGVAAILLTIAIFVIDALTSLGIAIAVLYALVIILGAASLDRRGLIVVSVLCVVFTLVAFLFGHGDSFDTDAAIRCAISLCAIVVTTLLSLRNQEATLQLKDQAALLDLTHDAIFVRDAGDTITYWNRGAERLYGWPAEDAVGRKATELLKTRFPLELAGLQADLLETGRWEGELIHTRRDGFELTVLSRWSLHRDPHGRPVATMEINSDITERREAESALHRAQAELSHVSRVTTLGELAASIAHETNQPLAAVVTNGDAGLRWLSREPPNIDAARMSLEKMIGNARRASDVIARLRALARRSEAEHLPLDLNDVVDDTLLLVQRELAERRVDLNLSFDPSVPEVLGDRVQLQQVVINLVMNALQAMDNAGGQRRLRIATRRETPENGGGAVLEVTDSGMGFDTDKAGKLFAAFYTTKPDGMGMGLSISRSIVEAHRGQISASANEGPGATFTVRIPSPPAGDQ